ncbi:hypothetical protein AB4K20DRAFT_1866328 [Rhizopus microsporus]
MPNRVIGYAEQHRSVKKRGFNIPFTAIAQIAHIRAKNSSRKTPTKLVMFTRVSKLLRSWQAIDSSEVVEWRIVMPQAFYNDPQYILNIPSIYPQAQLAQLPQLTSDQDEGS